MHKHIKNFGRELAFLLVLVMTLSSGGLNVFAGAKKDVALKAAEILKAISAGDGLTLPYLVGGYNKTEIIAAAQKAANPRFTGTAMSAAIIGLKTYTTFGELNSVIIANSADTASKTTLAVAVTVNITAPSNGELIQEAHAYIKETGATQTISSDVRSSTIKIPYKVGGYTNPEKATKAASVLKAAFGATAEANEEDKYFAISGAMYRRRDLSAITIVSVSVDGSKYTAVMSLGNVKDIELTSIDVKVKAAAIADKIQEAAQLILRNDGGTVEIPYGTYSSTTVLAKPVLDAINTMMNETERLPVLSSGQVQDLASVSATDISIKTTTGTPKWIGGVKQGGGGGTVMLSKGYPIAMADPSNQTVVNVARVEITDMTSATYTGLVIICDTKTGDDAYRAAEVAVREILNKSAVSGKQKSCLFPLDLSEVGIEVKENVGGTPFLHLTYGDAETEIKLGAFSNTPLTSKLLGEAEAEFKNGITIDYNPLADFDPETASTPEITNAYTTWANMAKIKVSARLAELGVQGAIVTVDRLTNIPTFKLTFKAGDPAVTKTVDNFKITMDENPDVATLENALTVINGAVTIPYVTGGYPNDPSKIAESRAAEDSILAELAADDDADDYVDIRAQVTYNKETGLFELVLRLNAASNDTLKDLKVTVGANPDVAMVNSALLLLKTKVKIPYADFTGKDEVARASAATVVVNGWLASDPTLEGVEALVTWKADQLYYVLTVSKNEVSVPLNGYKVESCPDTAALEAAINEAEPMLVGIVSKPDGTLPADVKEDVVYWLAADITTFNTAITAAKTALTAATAPDTTKTAADVATATTALDNAITAFKAAKETGTGTDVVEPVDTEALEDAIADAEDLLVDIVIAEDATEVDEDVPFWTQDDVDALEAVIEAAKAVLADVAATQDDVNEAVTDLNAAMDDFKAAEQTGTGAGEEPVLDTATLEAAIADAKDLHDNALTGEDPAEVEKDTPFWSEAAKSAFAEAIKAAEAVLANEESTQDDIDAAVEALETAQSTFEAAVQTGTKEDTEPEDRLDWWEDPDTGLWYYYETANKLVGDGWYEMAAGVTYYFVDGTPILGWKELKAGEWHFFNNVTGSLVTGFHTFLPGQTPDFNYYFDPENNGAAAKGWFEVDGAWYCSNDVDATMIKGWWEPIPGVKFYFNLSDGKAFIGGSFEVPGEGTFEFNEDGMCLGAVADETDEEAEPEVVE